MCQICDDHMPARRGFLTALGSGLAVGAMGLMGTSAIAAGGATTSVTADQALDKLKSGNERYVSQPQLCVADLSASRDAVAKGLPSAGLDASFEIDGQKRGVASAAIHIFDDDGGIIEAPAIIADQGRYLGERIGAGHLIAVGHGRVIFEGQALLDHGDAHLLHIGAAA